MNWLARLKKIDLATTAEATETTKRVSVVFVGPDMAPVQKTGGDLQAANDTTPNSDRWAWPHSPAMNTAEIETFAARVARFAAKGLSDGDAEALADKLVTRDRDGDDRRLCVECAHLVIRAGRGGSCRNGRPAGLGIMAGAVELPQDWIVLLQNCPGFRAEVA